MYRLVLSPPFINSHPCKVPSPDSDPLGAEKVRKDESKVKHDASKSRFDCEKPTRFDFQLDPENFRACKQEERGITRGRCGGNGTQGDNVKAVTSGCETARACTTPSSMPAGPSPRPSEPQARSARRDPSA